MDRDEAFALVRARIEQEEVPTLKGQWEASRTYCVAPADVRLSLHLLVKGALTSESPELTIFSSGPVPSSGNESQEGPASFGLLSYLWREARREMRARYRIAADKSAPRQASECERVSTGIQ